jgi:hypothetical protein
MTSDSRIQSSFISDKNNMFNSLPVSSGSIASTSNETKQSSQATNLMFPGYLDVEIEGSKEKDSQRQDKVNKLAAGGKTVCAQPSPIFSDMARKLAKKPVDILTHLGSRKSGKAAGANITNAHRGRVVDSVDQYRLGFTNGAPS